MKAIRLLLFFATVILLLAARTTRLDFGALQPAHAAPARTAYNINIPILGYHKVDLTAPTEWYVSAEQFARQMD
ncbi:hypothetical protein, partial [Klebsiella pneumoniae]|uniref:hypothetical protein n=1 Tax=Klebsiella pneumoniae TaxID=573 RepID=UPI001E633AEE